MKNKNFETSSGNIFADLGMPNPEERLAKVKLVMQINLIMEERGLNQKDAAKLLGIDQPKISALSTGQLAGFSIQRLFRFLHTLGQDIAINITPRIAADRAPYINVNAPEIKGKSIGAPAPSSMLASKNK
jgi:predicted XRE-type DNA-binding protein